MLRSLFLVLFGIFLFHQNGVAEIPEKEILLGGWFPWIPYQYEEDRGESGSLTGLDVQLVKALAAHVKKKVNYEPVPWKQHLEDLKEGKRDFASAATFTEERTQFVYFSIPYRYEEESLFIPREKEGEYSFKTVDEMLKFFEESHFRIGVVDGFIYADPKINEWLKKPEYQKQIIRVQDDTESLENLMSKKIDGFLAERVVGATVIWKANQGRNVAECRLGIKAPLHLIFSKKTVSQSLVDKFNQAIEKMQRSDEYTKIVSWYWHPILLLQTIDSKWFKIIDYLGTIAFAISGLVIAYRDRSTLFGAFIFALLPSLGGGIIRDVIFGRRPIGAMQSPTYLVLVILTVLIGFLCIRLKERFFRNTEDSFETLFSRASGTSTHILVVCDAFGLAAFTVTGIIVSLIAKASPLWLWGAFFAFLTGAGGGILRDSLSKERNIVSLRGQIYPEIAVIWGFLLSVFLTYQAHKIDPDPLKWAVATTVVGAFITRLVVYYTRLPNIGFSPQSSRMETP